jgi:hypothetical protein
MRTPIAFLVGAIAATLVAAAAFRGAGQPLDSTFTYQGQLRNAGQLVNGPVDVRFTLWDSDVAGSQIGTANSFNNYPLADGRFALGLNFGAGAFNGDQRWVQVEFRSPAAVGQYLTLNPRDKINATPYALYALNGVESQWSYNSKTQALSTAVGKVGIGTSTPTAALEVVGVGGDDAVKLPAGSVGAAELGIQLSAVALFSAGFSPGTPTSVTKSFSVDAPCVLLFQGSAGGGGAAGVFRVDLTLDGVLIGTVSVSPQGVPSTVNLIVDVPAGAHTLVASGYIPQCGQCGVGITTVITALNRRLVLE